MHSAALPWQPVILESQGEFQQGWEFETSEAFGSATDDIMPWIAQHV